MIIIGLVSWWYTSGWLMCARKTGERILGTLRFFSVGELLGSLFAPFRQISAGHVNGPIGMQLRAWGDKQFSRVVGFVVRSMLIIVGLITVVVVAVAGVVSCLVWPLLPLAPAVGLLLVGIGA